MLFTFLKPNPCTTFSMQFWMRNLMNYISTYPQKLLYISVKNMPIISKARVTYIGIPESFALFLDHCVLYDQAKPKIFYILPRRHEVLTLEGEEDLKVWQYEFLSFQGSDTKLDRFLPIVLSSLRKCKNLTFKVNYPCQKWSDSFK